MRTLWDEPKRRTTLATRGLDFARLTPEFFLAAVTRPVRFGRYQAIAPLDGRLLAVVFAELGSEAYSVISMRPASRAERRIYEAKAPTDLR